jgi:hypothetical protein
MFSTAYLVLAEAAGEGLSVSMVSGANGKTSEPVQCALAAESGDLDDTLGCMYAGILAAHRELARLRPGPLPAVETRSAEAAHPAVADVGKGTPTKDEHGAREPHWYASWWFWSLVAGAVALSAGVTLGVVLPQDEGDHGYRFILTRPK